MSTRILATIAFRTMAVWLFASGALSLVSGLFTWQPDVAQFGAAATGWRLAAASLFLPIGGLLWVISPGLAAWSCAADEQIGVAQLTRADLYAFASLLVGLFLLADAFPQIAYWIVLWRSAGDTEFWSSSSEWRTDRSVVYWVHARAQVGLVLAQVVMGICLVLGPERLARVFMRARKELSSNLADESVQGSGPA